MERVMTRFIFGVTIISCAFLLPVPQEAQKAIESPPQPILEQKEEVPIEQPAAKKVTQMLYFGATWCPPCKKMKQLFKDPEVKKELDRLDFRMYDEARDRPMFDKFNITLYPTTIFQAEGKIGTRYTGSMPKSQLLQILRSIE
jgi:thiol-disulfide isomerase/thioredoxin